MLLDGKQGSVPQLQCVCSQLQQLQVLEAHNQRLQEQTASSKAEAEASLRHLKAAYEEAKQDASRLIQENSELTEQLQHMTPQAPVHEQETTTGDALQDPCSDNQSPVQCS